MTKRNLLLVGLLLVFGLGVMAPAALAQAPAEGNGTIINVAPSLYTLRPNSTGDADGAIFLNFSSGYGTIAGGEVFTIAYSQPIVGASKIAGLADPAADFCDDTHATGIVGTFCSAMTYTASGKNLVLTNGVNPISGWTGGYITIWGTRAATSGLLAGSYITATVGAALNESYPISFSSQGTTVSNPVNVGEVANTTIGGSVYATSSPGTLLSCLGTSGGEVYFYVDIAEQWAGAWTALSDELSLAPFAPTASSLATNGSIISITVNGIPSGAEVIPEEIELVTGHQVWAALPAAYTGTMPNDSHTFEFTLTSTVRQEVEEDLFWFEVVTTGAVPGNSPGMTASVYLNPLAPSTTLYPAFVYPSGTLSAEPTSPLNAVAFVGCQTSLLWPYVTNYSGGTSGGPLGNWDTAMEIANTTSDPFGGLNFGGAIPQDGSCTFYVYNAGTAAAARATPTTATPITWTTPVVLSGGDYSFMLSTTPAATVVGGYAIAICNFQNAVGYAALVDNANGLGTWEAYSNYLAYVIPNPYLEPRWEDGIVGEFAITPWSYFDCYYGCGGVKGAGASSHNARVPLPHNMRLPGTK